MGIEKEQERLTVLDTLLEQEKEYEDRLHKILEARAKEVKKEKTLRKVFWVIAIICLIILIVGWRIYVQTDILGTVASIITFAAFLLIPILILLDLLNFGIGMHRLYQCEKEKKKYSEEKTLFNKKVDLYMGTRSKKEYNAEILEVLSIRNQTAEMILRVHDENGVVRIITTDVQVDVDNNLKESGAILIALRPEKTIGRYKKEEFYNGNLRVSSFDEIYERMKN